MAARQEGCASELMITTGMGWKCISFFRNVRPSMRGISISSVSTSGCSARILSRATYGSGAVPTTSRSGSPASASVRILRTMAESSTISTRILRPLGIPASPLRTLPSGLPLPSVDGMRRRPLRLAEFSLIRGRMCGAVQAGTWLALDPAQHRAANHVRQLADHFSDLRSESPLSSSPRKSAAIGPRRLARDAQRQKPGRFAFESHVRTIRSASASGAADAASSKASDEEHLSPAPPSTAFGQCRSSCVSVTAAPPRFVSSRLAQLLRAGTAWLRSRERPGPAFARCAVRWRPSR